MGATRFKSEELSGCASTDSLPTAVREMLLERQACNLPGQAWAARRSIKSEVAWVIVCLFFCSLFIGAVRDKSLKRSELTTMLVIITPVVGWLSVLVIGLINEYRGLLRSRLYVTPLHIIETNHEVVRWWPIFAIRNMRTIHRHINFGYDRSVMLIDFTGTVEKFKLWDKEDVNLFLDTLSKNRVLLLRALEREDWDYFAANDDFISVSNEIRFGAAARPRSLYVRIRDWF